jgi:hypothetical protein
MHSQVPQAAVLTIELNLTLPIDRLLGIEIARVKEPTIDFDDPPKSFALDHVPDSLYGWEKGELRRASHQQLRAPAYCSQDGSVCRLVDAKGLLADQVLARFHRRTIKLLM